MNITSLLITLAGIIFILALYLISRIAQNKLPKDKDTVIPDLKNKDGTRFTSILDDIPARDGSTPSPLPTTPSADLTKDATSTEKTVAEGDKKLEEQEKEDRPLQETQEKIKPTGNQQHILFISAQEGSFLDGNQIKQALTVNGLTLGENDIYHYQIMANSQQISLFRVANGMDPWTLKEEDLDNKKLAGLSVVMLTPTKINDVKAMKTFINISKKLSSSINGVIKNQQQQLLSLDDEKSLIKSATKK